MPQGKDYIFCLQDKNFNFWRFNNGDIDISAREYFMTFAPDGWNEIAIQNIVNRTYKSIDRSVSIPLAYIMDGAQILKHIAYSKGLKEEVFLTVLAQQLNYEPYPKATLAFISGQTPFTPNTTTTGTITGTPGETVKVKVYLDFPGFSNDKVYGNFDAFNFIIDGDIYPTVHFAIYDLIIPVGGVINFSIYHEYFTGNSTAGMELLNANGNTSFGYCYWYKQVYRGEVDWSTFDHTGPKVTCTTMEDGLPKYLKANDKTVYEFPMDVPEAVNVKMDGIKLHNSVEDLVSDGVTSDPGYDFENHLIDLLITKEDAPYLGGKKEVRRTKVNNVNADIHATQAWFASTTDTGTLEFEYDFPVTITYFPPPAINPAGRYRIVVRSLDSGGTIVDQFVLLNIPADQITGIERRLTGSGTLATGDGYEFYLYAFFDVTGASGDAQIQTTYPGTGNSYFNYKYKYRQAATYIKAFRPQYLFGQLISKITEGVYSAATASFFTDNKTKVLTCGNAIRGITDATMKISFEGFFKFWDSIYSVGIIDRNPQVDFAEEHNLVDFTDIIDLGQPDISTLKVSVAKDELINEVNIGFPDISSEVGVLNGNEEFNTGTLWSTDATTLTGKLDKISPIKASCYEIEKIRIATFKKDTTDYKNDNDNYAVHITDTLIPASGSIPDHYELDRTLNALVTAGLLEPETVFNLWFSPARSLARNGINIHGRFYKSDTDNFNFRSANKNSKLVCDGVTENANINVGALPGAILVPWLFDIEVSPPDDLISLLDQNPLKGLQFTLEGNTYLMIQRRTSIASSSKKSQQIQGRSAATNDLTKLINYSG